MRDKVYFLKLRYFQNTWIWQYKPYCHIQVWIYGRLMNNLTPPHSVRLRVTFLTQDVNFDKIKRMVTLHYQNLTVVWDMLHASGPYFVSFLSLHILFRLVSQFTYFVSFRFVVFRFVSLCFVSHFTVTLKYDI